VVRALRYRDEVRVWRTRDGAGHVLVGRGLAGRWETAFEVESGARGRGLGRHLAAAATALVPAGAHVWAQVAPGNAASLRAVLAAGYRPICAEVLLPPARGS
jgi:GNAT superfamily N-acetyltransferase